MKGKTLHVVSSPSMMGTLKSILDKNGKKDNVVFLPFDFSYGYMPKDFSDKEICFTLASHNQIGLFDELKKFLTTDYDKYEKVIVWHGWAANESFLLYLMSVLTKENLYHIELDTPEMGCFGLEEITEVLFKEEPVSEALRKQYIKEWNKWSKSESFYRLSDGPKDRIKEYSKDFMDECIFDCVKRGFGFYRIVGSIMMEFERLNLSGGAIVDRILKLWDESALNFSVSIEK